MKTKFLALLLFFFFLSGTLTISSAQDGHHASDVTGHNATDEIFDASTFIMEHIADSHEWHLWTRKNGESVAIYLPVIVFSKGKGLEVFSSERLKHGHTYNGYRIEEEGDLKGLIVNVNEEGHIDEENLPLDFSFTKTIVGLFFSCLIGLLLFLSLSRSYKKTGISHPRGIQSFLEPIILFVRDDIAISNIGKHKYEKYMPYLLTVFFFILINNLMGLIPFPPPFGANVTGNIAVTFVLAFFTFIITQFSGNKELLEAYFCNTRSPLLAYYL